MTVSILIPCYNAGKWIRPAVDSALAQIGIDHEVVVVDDGSTDETVAILEEFGSRILLERAPHAGGNAARNRLLARSRGEWLQFLDADDYLAADKIEAQLRAVAPADLLRTDVIYSPVVIEAWTDDARTGQATHRIDTGADIFTQWLLWQMPQTGGALWRRSALERIGGWNEKMPCCQEHELYFRALRAGLRFRYADAAGAFYRHWSDVTVSRRDIRQLIDVRTTLILEFVAWLRRENQLTAPHRAAAGQMIFEMARRLAPIDLEAAARYYKEHREAGFILPHGPAAPLNYRVALAAGGFRFAEKLAAALR
jgi:glycosyltransferase involved in cell wall biosynthesis